MFTAGYSPSTGSQAGSAGLFLWLSEKCPKSQAEGTENSQGKCAQGIRACATVVQDGRYSAETRPGGFRCRSGSFGCLGAYFSPEESISYYRIAGQLRLSVRCSKATGPEEGRQGDRGYHSEPVGCGECSPNTRAEPAFDSCEEVFSPRYRRYRSQPNERRRRDRLEVQGRNQSTHGIYYLNAFAQNGSSHDGSCDSICFDAVKILVHSSSGQ